MVGAEYIDSQIDIHKQMNKRVFQIVLFIAGLILLLIGLVLSVSVGAVDINFSTVIGAILSFDQSKEHMIISTIRLPRAIIGAIIGMNLAVAGALMQALTRNPMASPQIFGVNAGASLVVVSATVLLPNISPSTLVYFAFIGAAIGGLVVYTMASSGGSIAPVKLALAGMAVHLFFSSITEALIIFNETTTEAILFWLAGAIDGSTWNDIGIIMPWSLVGLLISILLSRSISVFSLGEDVAKGLGQKIEIIRIVSGITVIVLAGSSVAIAGPIGFVGLIIPHITRAIVGIDYRVVIPFSALFGALLLVYADVASRFIAFPFESPVGIVTALIGAPFFLYLARKGGKLS